MAALVIKNLPDHLHGLLKQAALRNRRSMTQETVHILEEKLLGRLPAQLPEPIKPRRKVTAAMIRRGIRTGRE